MELGIYPQLQTRKKRMKFSRYVFTKDNQQLISKKETIINQDAFGTRLWYPPEVSAAVVRCWYPLQVFADAVRCCSLLLPAAGLRRRCYPLRYPPLSPAAVIHPCQTRACTSRCGKFCVRFP